jgi:hypothetical protein
MSNAQQSPFWRDAALCPLHLETAPRGKGCHESEQTHRPESSNGRVTFDASM